MRTDTPLEAALIGRIEREGPLTFRDFMDAALYDDENGYYSTGRSKIGVAGDYYTASSVQPAFGATLAQAFAALWAGNPDPLAVTEVGAGTGILACNILTSLRDEHPRLFKGMKYAIVERSRAMRERQQSILAGFADLVIWSGPRAAAYPKKGIVFSNELIDAMAVHRVRAGAGGLEEQYVSASDGRLSLIWNSASTGRLDSYVRRMGVTLEPGQIVEVGLDAVDWLGTVSSVLDEGLLVTIDYGDEAAALYSTARRNGTVRCFHRHRLSDAVLARVGEQDITSSVNFTALIEYGFDVGLEPVALEPERQFLIGSGLLERVAALTDREAKLVAKNLLVPGGVTEGFKVLVQRKVPHRSSFEIEGRFR